MVVSQPGMMGQVAGSQARVEGVEERLGPKIETANKALRYCVKKIKYICLYKYIYFASRKLGLLSDILRFTNPLFIFQDRRFK